MFFASDNWAGAHPAIAARLSGAADGFSTAYGDGDLDRAVYEKFSQIFEREVAVFFVATGTAANSLSLALYGKPGGISFCHREAHIVEDECGAVEYLSGGGRLQGIDGNQGRMKPIALEQALGHFFPESVHTGRPTTISITQSTEIGTVYSLQDIETISTIAGSRNLPLHMDGARFANALVSLETTAAEMTWKRGVDIVSFGGTKNGCWCAEAIILFDLELAREMAFLRKRAGQLFSKSRFVAAQFVAYFHGDLWLENARHSNSMASRLAGMIDAALTARLAWQPQANEVFAIIGNEVAAKLQAAGATFHHWPAPAGFAGELGEDEKIYRFVTSFATREEDIDRLADLIR